MPHSPETISLLLTLMVFIVGPLGLTLSLLLKRRWARRFDRLGESSSEEMLEELSNAYTPRRHIAIRTPTEYLPFVFEGIREVVDGGFDDKQVRSLLARIDIHRPYDVRQALFPVEVKGRPSDLLFRWSRDSGDRIRLHVTAAPEIIRALRVQKKRIPLAALA